jgi:tetratricopeptide (TPR) repeat protein
VRPLVISLCSIALAGAVSVPLAAETIHLKNGRTIWADRVRENGPKIEYEVGEDTYAIPKASVLRVDAGGVAPEHAASAQGAGGAREIPAIVMQPMASESDVAGKIIHDGKVDVDELHALEKTGNSIESAVGYLVAGKHEFAHGNLPLALSYYQNALRLQPDNAVILEYYAVLLIRTGSAAQALGYAEHAARLDPKSPDALAVLGFAQFANDRTRDAIRSWKESQRLRPDTTLQQYIDKAQRELSAENDFSQRESSHFTLRYEGTQTPEALRRAVLATLEQQFAELSSQLETSPRDTIPVILYTNQAFFDVTQAPSWIGAVNDGKLRIPVSGMSAVTPELARALKHELAHSFINYMSHGRCPLWLHEGMAQLLEPKSLGSNGLRLSQLFHAQHELPYNMLESSFMQFSTGEAVLAYDESLAAVEYIHDTYGMGDLQRILQRLGEGGTAEAALRTTIHSNYAQLEGEVGKFLATKYGD